MTQKNWNLELVEYIKVGEPDEVEKAKAWGTAIGLQEVDGLKPSKYLIDTAKEHIEGNINIEEVENRINLYYKVLDKRKTEEVENTEEADKVSVRITEILSDKSFNFNPTELISIHQRLFSGVYKHAGKIRDYNIEKEEWVLKGDTVIYASYETIMDSLQYDFEQEKNFSYKDLSLEESIKHLCRFTSNIWQVHPFCDENEPLGQQKTYLQKYLQNKGFTDFGKSFF